MKIGQNIARLRDMKGISQHYMASKLEMHERTYSRLEHRITDSEEDSPMVEKIADVLEVKPDVLREFDANVLIEYCENAYGSNYTYYAYSPKEAELYEKLIAELQSVNQTLRDEILWHKKEIERLNRK